MSKGGRDHFEEFEEHTLLKHLILDKYVKAWAIKLLRWLGGDSQVWFVDAFAGEGGDRKGNPGSPVIAARIAFEIGRSYPRTDHERAPMRVLAIEKDHARYERLCDAMKPFTTSSPRIAEVRHGTLTERLERFMEYVKQEPVLFFLDPFGVDGLLVDDFPLLLSGPHNEVFALFSDIGAKRLHATLLTEERDIEYEVAEVLSAPTFFPELDQIAVAAKRTEVERSSKALRQTKVASQRILAGALGPQAVAELNTTPEDERPARLTQIYVRRLREAGAKYVISFPVRDARNANVYQLVHASKSKQGLRAMKESMQAALNSSTLPLEVRTAISYALAGKENEVVRELAQHFAGREIRWTEGNDRAGTTSIKKYLLEETLIFPGQFSQVKDELVSSGFRSQSKPLMFRFPRS